MEVDVGIQNIPHYNRTTVRRDSYCCFGEFSEMHYNLLADMVFTGFLLSQKIIMTIEEN